MQLGSLLPVLCAALVPQAAAPTSAGAPGLDGVITAAFHWGDFNADGLEDAFAIQADGSTALLQNQGDGYFESVGARAGLDDGARASTAAWGDFDGDGFLDLYVGTSVGPGALYQNRGDGTFADVTPSAGFEVLGGARGAAWFDYDADLRADLFITTALGEVVYHGLGGGHFERIALPLAAPSAGFGEPGAAHPPGLTESAQAAKAVLGALAGAPTLATPTQAATAIVVTPGAVSVSQPPIMPALPCIESMRDQATGPCVQASSMPTLGMLYPLGTEFYIDAASGRVGLGTTAPAASLHVLGTGVATDLLLDRPGGSQLKLTANLSTASVGTTNAQDLRLVTNNSVRVAVTAAGDMSVGTAFPDGRLDVRSSGSGDILNLFDGSTQVMTVLDGGNLGLGTTAPTSKLFVAGGDVTVSSNFSSNTQLGGILNVDYLGTGTQGDALVVRNPTTGGNGVEVLMTGTGTGTAQGVRVVLNTEQGRGVSAQANGTTGPNFAGHFVAFSTAGTGVYGKSEPTTGTGKGVYGESDSSAGFGGYFFNTSSGTGLFASSQNGSALVADKILNSGNIMVAQNGSDIEFRVDSSGDVFCDQAFIGGGADYAEWLERADANETFAPGDVVGVRGGKISKNLAGAHTILVISTNPVLVGNAAGAEESERAGFERAAFLGQVPVRIIGPVAVGDFVLPSGQNDGTAVAVAPADIAPAELARVFGRAWERKSAAEVLLVDVAVGLDQAAASALVIESLEQDLTDAQDRLKDVEERLLALESSRP